MRGLRRAAALAVAGALVVGACGGGSDDGDGGASGDDASTTTTTRSSRGNGACETLTRAQARAVVPGTGRGRATGSPLREATCVWRGDDGAQLRINYSRPEGTPAAQVAAAAGDPVAVGEAGKIAVSAGPDGDTVTIVAAVGEVLVTAEATGPRATPEALTTAVREAIAYATR